MAKRPATIASTTQVARTVGAEGLDLPIDAIRPNSWNPNVQSDWMFEKELASIEEYGFVVPIVVRHLGEDLYEVIDGEHRWKAAKQLGYTEVPCWNLGVVDDDVARELTIVLNETKGRAQEDKLQVLLADLLSRRPEQKLREIMPFSRERFDELVNRRQIDWGVLEDKRKELKDASETRWKELVYRLPYEAAVVVERAFEQMMEREGLSYPWQCLEMLAADYSAGT